MRRRAKLTPVPQEESETYKPNIRKCPKCHKVLGRGSYMHLKMCGRK